MSKDNMFLELIDSEQELSNSDIMFAFTEVQLLWDAEIC